MAQTGCLDRVDRVLTFLAEARRGPTRQPLLAFSSQDLRPGPWPARHRRFRALGLHRLAVRTASCGSCRERFAPRRVGEYVSSDVLLCASYQS